MHIIGGKFKKKPLVVPKNEETRPTTSSLREAVFNICQTRIHGARFLDVFAGSGAMGLEALSREAEHACFIENNRTALSAIKKNIATLKVEEQASVFGCDVFKALSLLLEKGEAFDIIYVDPPYGAKLSEGVLSFFDEHSLLADDGLLLIEDSSMHEPILKHLKLKNQRRVGPATLYEYVSNYRKIRWSSE